MALMCLSRVPEVFTAAAAGQPGRLSARTLLTHALDIRGPLLLIHGLTDENVHFRHTARLLDVLVPAGIAHELLLFPEERHHVRREEHRVTLERRIATLFQRHL